MPRNLTRRNGVWYANLNVPTALRGILGANLQRSLRTTDEREAVRRSHKVLAEFQERIDNAMKEPSSLDSLIHLAKRYRHGDGVTAADFDASFEAVVEAYPKDIQGEPKVPREDVAKIRKAAAIAAGTEERLLSSLAERWLAAEETKGHTAKNNALRKRMLDRFLEWIGEDADPSSITKAKAAAYAEVVNEMDVGKKTRKDAIQYVVAFTDWLEVLGHIEANPFTKAAKLVRKNLSKDDREQVHENVSDETLGRLLHGLPQGSNSAALMALMAYTGARPGELCEVKTEHVTDSVISIRKKKTASSVRDVPIHPVIAPLVRKLVSESTDGYLIAGLKPCGPDKDRYTTLGKRIARQAEKILGADRQRTYDLRGTVNSKMRNAGVADWLCERVLGHKPATINARHYTVASLEVIAEALSKVSYGKDVDTFVKQMGADFRRPRSLH